MFLLGAGTGLCLCLGKYERKLRKSMTFGWFLCYNNDHKKIQMNTKCIVPENKTCLFQLSQIV